MEDGHRLPRVKWKNRRRRISITKYHGYFGSTCRAQNTFLSLTWPRGFTKSQWIPSHKLKPLFLLWDLKKRLQRERYDRQNKYPDRNSYHCCSVKVSTIHAEFLSATQYVQRFIILPFIDLVSVDRSWRWWGCTRINKRWHLQGSSFLLLFGAWSGGEIRDCYCALLRSRTAKVLYINAFMNYYF